MPELRDGPFPKEGAESYCPTASGEPILKSCHSAKQGIRLASKGSNEKTTINFRNSASLINPIVSLFQSIKMRGAGRQEITCDALRLSCRLSGLFELRCQKQTMLSH